MFDHSRFVSPSGRRIRGAAVFIGQGETIIKVMVLLHGANGMNWQPPPKGTSLKTLSEAEEQGFILIRGEFQKRQFRLTERGFEYIERDKRRLDARKR